jgi:hypothetical protein
MPAAIGDNSRELTPAERRALYFNHYAKIAAQTEICRQANEERKRLRKVAKADGIVLSDVDYGLRCATIEDPDIIVAEQIRRNEIARWFALPVGQQADFDFNRQPLVERAAAEGRAAGYAAKDRTPPHDIASKAGQAWLSAYDEAQAAMRADLAAAMTKKNAGKAKADDGSNDPDHEDEAA